MEKEETLSNLLEKVKEEIITNAKSLGLSSDDLEPITDGIVDIKKYLHSKYKIMWVLKEPYDDVDEQGKPCGGGWDMSEGFRNSDGTVKESAKSNKTWLMMAYTTYGIQYNIHYDDMDSIWKNEEILECLMGTAYINISKMPNLTNSNRTNLYSCYNIWKDVLFKQIEICNPDIIIFGGNIAPFWSDLQRDGIVFARHRDAIDVYSYKGKKIIKAYHPNQRRIKWCVYADSIIDECNCE